MPIYEYRCQECGEKLEIIVRGEQPKVCGKYCIQGPPGKGELKKLISLPSRHATPTTDSDIAASGMTKLKKTSDGTYERVVGPPVAGTEGLTKPPG